MILKGIPPMNEETTPARRKRPPGEMHSIGTLQGLPPGRIMHHVGLLDLRDAVPEQLALVEEIHTVDVLLLAEETRAFLQPANMHHVGSIIVATSEERVLVTPQLELSCSGIEALPGGQKLLVMGSVFFQPDVPAGLVAEKFESLRVFGVLIACRGVHGALVGKMQILNGVTLALPDEIGTVVRAQGETRMTPEYLSALSEGTTYVNVGQMHLDDGLSVEMMRTQIDSYYNVGDTIGPASLIATLQARCSMNLGHFRLR